MGREGEKERARGREPESQREREGKKGRDLAVKTNCSFIALVIETCS